MIVWRISEFADLTGIGGKKFSARWHIKGKPIVYCAESPAGALLERIVHIEKEDIPDNFQLLEIEIPDENLSKADQYWEEAGGFTHKPSDKVSIITLEHRFRSVQRGDFPALHESQSIGDSWLKEGSSLALRVPSVIVPQTYNVLLNPKHPLMKTVKLHQIIRYPFDARFSL